MVSIATGFWYDYSQPLPQRPTLTLPAEHGDKLVSFLTFLVTLAGASFWDIVALLLHSWKVKQPKPTALDLQHRVSLRNTRSSSAMFWRILKIHWAWSGRRPPGLLGKTCSIAAPALLVWLLFAAASLFTSSVATKAYGTVIARIDPQNCGFTDSSKGDQASKILNDTMKARTYVATFYANTTNSATARSAYLRPTFQVSVNTTAPCPVPDTERCMLGPNGAFSISSEPLNSNDHLGINAPVKDRINLHMKTTCSPIILYRDEVGVGQLGNTTVLNFYLGPMAGVSNETHFYNTQNIFGENGYQLELDILAFHLRPKPKDRWANNRIQLTAHIPQIKAGSPFRISIARTPT